MPQPNSEHELKALGEQLKRKPGHAPVLFRMAELERAAGRHAEAAAHLREILKAEPGKGSPLELGRALFEAGDVQAALAETASSLTGSRRNVDALYNLGAITGTWAISIRRGVLGAGGEDRARIRKRTSRERRPLTRVPLQYPGSISA